MIKAALFTRPLVLVGAVLFLCLTPLHAASFSAKRGINLDLWVTWPNEAEWWREDVLLPYPEWQRTVGLDELAALKGTGFDFVRIPVDPLPFLSSQSAPLRQRLLASVLEGVQRVNSAGLNAIVDLHPIPRGADRFAGAEELLREDALFERYLDLVREMGRTLSGQDPERVAFELMNEPVIDCEGEEADQWRDKLVRLFAAARSSAPRLTLVLTGACWSSAEGLAAIDPKEIRDDNVLWAFHSYAPFILTTQGAQWAGDFIRYVTGIPYPPYAFPEQLAEGLENARQTIGSEAPLTRRLGMLAYLEEQIAMVDTKEELEAEMSAPFRTVAAWAEKNGIEPGNIILGEFGMIRQEYESPAVMNPQWRAAYVRDIIRLAEDRGFAWSLWGYGGAFGIVEEFGGRKAEKDVLDVVKHLGE